MVAVGERRTTDGSKHRMLCKPLALFDGCFLCIDLTSAISLEELRIQSDSDVQEASVTQLGINHLTEER